MRLSLTAALAALGALLTGCEDHTVVTRVDKRIDDMRSYVVPMAAGGLPVEIYGAPFDGVTEGEIIARLRLPGGWPTDIGFRAADRPGERGRLVLAFNIDGPPNGRAMCAGTIPRLGPARQEGFTVLASFCNGDRLLSTGHMEARNTRADDPEAFRRVMTHLFQNIL
jgi:hypothetical protein